MKPLRPSAWQETVRQWILLIPLATAIVGTLGITVGPDEEWVDFLPPIFFVGALVVTASMMHQRRMASDNLQLAEQVHNANERLDTLHRLGLELNKRLELLPVAQTLLDDSLRSLDVDAAALWMRRESLPSTLLGAAFWQDLPLKSSAEAESGQWCCIAQSGFAQPDQQSKLADWDNALESNQWAGQALSFRVSAHRTSARAGIADSEAPSFDPLGRLISLSLSHRRKSALQDSGVGSATLASVFSSPNAAAIVPIVWEGEVVGAVLMANWNRALAKDDLVLLNDIALVAAPALQNALLFGAATARAEIDALTGLYNHRVLQERLTQELARASRALDTNPASRLSLAIMDVTDFKLFNDTYGHGTGDKVLQFIAESLRSGFRAGDVIARYGGDEFVVVLPNTDVSHAERTCRRAIESIASRPFEPPDGSRVAVRVACGLATFPADGRTIAELISSADERLYAAKKRGQLMLETVPSGEGEAPGSAILPDEARLEASARNMEMWRDLHVYEALIAAIDIKDKYTRRHTEGVCFYALMLAKQMGLSEEMRQAVRIASLVHDVGKIVVPDAILRKPGRLSEDEVRIMRRHVIFGEQLVSEVPQKQDVLAGVRHHHERWDGEGYPDNLKGEEIPFMARLLAVPDSFVAMTIDRPYRRGLSIEEALQELEREAGVQFDPQVVEAFARAVRHSP